MRFLSLTVFASAAAALAVRQPSAKADGAVASDLTALISAGSQATVELRARWSEYNPPQPAVVVNVTSEKDVAAVVKYCTKYRIPFLAQNGGVAWASTFNLGNNGVIINLAALNTVTVSKDKKQVIIGGGAQIGDVIPAADAAGALVITGNCNCVGAVGAMLGGGYGNLLGEVGLGLDNIISLRVVLASGEIVTASKDSNKDLFWAMRGAGPNFGVVISATVNALPAAAKEERSGFINNLFFSPDKLVQVAQLIQDIPLLPTQRVYLVLTGSGPPLNEPSILVTGFLRKGTVESGRKAFAPFYDLGPVSESSIVVPYTEWNVGNDGFCTRGERKPGYSTSMKNMQVNSWPEVWELYKEFQAKGPNSAMLVERYNLTKVQTLPGGPTAFNQELRNNAFAQAIVLPWYADPALDDEALEFGQKVRQLWTQVEDSQNHPTYVNFAHGDETQEAIYGTSLGRLRQLKKQYDPAGVFNQWFQIKA